MRIGMLPSERRAGKTGRPHRAVKVMLTTAEAAKFLGISAHKLGQRWDEWGFSRERRGPGYVYDRSELKAFRDKERRKMREYVTLARIRDAGICDSRVNDLITLLTSHQLPLARTVMYKKSEVNEFLRKRGWL